MEEFLCCWCVESDQIQNWAQTLWWSGTGWSPKVQLLLEPWDACAR